MVALPVGKPIFLFVIVAFAYNLAWTAVGSLIRYYSFTYGASFFVYLNVAFYAVGLPVTYIQRKYDTYYDTLLGSTDTFLMRVSLLLLISVALLQCAPITTKMSMLALAMGIGLCTWFSHGTVTNLSSIAKNQSSTYQQVGFMLPGAMCILLVLVLELDVDIISRNELYRYYIIISALVLSGVIAWVVLCRSDLIRTQLQLKDDQTGAMVLRSEISAHGLWEYPEIRNLMRRIVNASAAVRRDADAVLQSTNVPSAEINRIRQMFSPSISNADGAAVMAQGDDIEIGMETIGTSRITGANDEWGEATVNPMCSTEMTLSCDKTRTQNFEKSETDLSVDSISTSDTSAADPETCVAAAMRTTFTDYSQIRISDLMNYPAVQDQVQKILEQNSSDIVQQACAHIVHTKARIYRTRWSLFITIFCSVLQGSFLAYVKSSNGWPIATFLFFLRNFSDLSGRVLALVLPKPDILMQVDTILGLAIVRIFLMLIFFLYILLPSGDFFLSNTFIVIYQFIFSIFSGYFSCCLYELASKEFEQETDRSFAGQLMSTTFQWACFLAVIVALMMVLINDAIADSMGHG